MQKYTCHAFDMHVTSMFQLAVYENKELNRNFHEFYAHNLLL